MTPKEAVRTLKTALVRPSWTEQQVDDIRAALANLSPPGDHDELRIAARVATLEVQVARLESLVLDTPAPVSAASEPTPTRCTATTKAGTRCKRNAAPGSPRCRLRH